MQGTAQAEITPQTAVHRSCWHCQTPLSGRQEKFCSEEHKNAYWSGVRSGTIERKRMDISAISGTRRQYKEMADGTLRVQIDIDPSFKRAFLELFPAIDTPVALAPLVNDFERKEPELEQPKGGKLSEWAGIKCREPEFWRFLRICGYDARNEEEARSVICSHCGVDTRAKLDHDAAAARRFNELFRLPYLNWTDKQRRQA